MFLGKVVVKIHSLSINSWLCVYVCVWERKKKKFDSWQIWYGENDIYIRDFFVILFCLKPFLMCHTTFCHSLSTLKLSIGQEKVLCKRTFLIIICSKKTMHNFKICLMWIGFIMGTLIFKNVKLAWVSGKGYKKRNESICKEITLFFAISNTKANSFLISISEMRFFSLVTNWSHENEAREHKPWITTWKHISSRKKNSSQEE